MFGVHLQGVTTINKVTPPRYRMGARKTSPFKRRFDFRRSRSTNIGVWFCRLQYGVETFHRISVQSLQCGCEVTLRDTPPCFLRGRKRSTRSRGRKKSRCYLRKSSSRVGARHFSGKSDVSKGKLERDPRDMSLSMYPLIQSTRRVHAPSDHCLCTRRHTLQRGVQMLDQSGLQCSSYARGDNCPLAALTRNGCLYTLTHR